MIDKRYPDIEKQAEIALEELTLAKTGKKNSTLHCVQATKLMLDILKNVKPFYKTVLWHNFNGSPETAAELYKLGVIISISPRCTKNILELFKANPLFTLETDYTGNNEHEQKEIITNHYENISKILSIPMEELERRCRDNAFTS